MELLAPLAPLVPRERKDLLALPGPLAQLAPRGLLAYLVAALELSMSQTEELACLALTLPPLFQALVQARR